jgi:carboxypeptidase Q
MGFIFSGKPEVGCVLNEVVKLMNPAPLNANLTTLTKVKFIPTDISSLTAAGVPGVVLNGNDGRYLWYHHTEADVLTIMDSKSLDTCLGVWASLSYVIADMKENFPRGS